MARVWLCKIVGPDEIDVPPGGDLPMRLAVQRAFREVTGESADFILSGWTFQTEEQSHTLLRNP